jgi:hypothetical protein
MKGWYVPLIIGLTIGFGAAIVGFTIINWQFWVIGAIGMVAYFAGIYRVTKGGWHD